VIVESVVLVREALFPRLLHVTMAGEWRYHSMRKEITLLILTLSNTLPSPPSQAKFNLACAKHLPPTNIGDAVEEVLMWVRGWSCSLWWWCVSSSYLQKPSRIWSCSDDVTAEMTVCSSDSTAVRIQYLTHPAPHHCAFYPQTCCAR
jgi:hypothetical protein